VRLIDYLDKGVSLGAAAPCLTMARRTLSYFDVQRLSWRIARALDRSGIVPGDKVAILSANDPVAFSCVIMPTPDLTEFLALVEKNKITHTFLPPTLIYMLLDHDRLTHTDTSHLQCLWYGAAPMSASRL